MKLMLANLFGVVSGTLLMFFVGLTLMSTVFGGMPPRTYLLIPFIAGWAIALVVTRPLRGTTTEILDRGLLLGAIVWGLAFPVTYVIILGRMSELEMVTSAHVTGYVLGGLIIGGGVTLLGIGLFIGLRFAVRRIAKKAQETEVPLKVHNAG
jgi:hypothetical protein